MITGKILGQYMSDPPAVVVKEKNPKKVAAGKNLAERNKMYKEHFEKTSGAASSVDESTPSDVSDTNYYVIGAVVLAVAGIMYYQSKPLVKQASSPLPVEEPLRPAPVKKSPSRLIKM